MLKRKTPIPFWKTGLEVSIIRSECKLGQIILALGIRHHGNLRVIDYIELNSAIFIKKWERMQTILR
jgi:hypothetical protein